MNRGRGYSTPIACAVAVVIAATGSLQASPLVWDGGDATPNDTFGGSGVWDLNNTVNWDSSGIEVPWTDGTPAGVDTAVFQGASGTVTLNSNVTAAGLVFATTGYTFSGPGVLTLGIGGIDASALSSGTTTFNIATTLTATQTWDIGAGSAIRVNSAIGGSAGLTKSGNGVLGVNASSTYTGPTTINGGTVNNAANTSSHITLGSVSSVLTINGGSIENSASSNDRNFTLVGSNQVWNGDFSLRNNGGSTRVTLSSAGGILLTGNRTVSTSGSGSAGAGVFISGGPISDGGNGYGITWAGNGGARVFLNSSASTYSGTTTITGGVIVFSGNVGVNANSAFGKAASDILVGATDTDINAAASSGLMVNSGASVFARNIVVRPGGTGTVTIGGLNTDASSGGTLNLTGNLALGTDAKGRDIILQRATVSGNITGAGGITITPVRATNGNAINSFSVTLSGDNTFTGGVLLTNTTLGSASSVVTLNINSPTALGSGTLTIGAAANAVAINSTAASPVTLTTHNAQVWNSNFTFTGTQSLNMGDGNVSLGVNPGDTRTITTNGAGVLTIGGSISDGTHDTTPTVNLTKAGPGTLVLAGANTYTGNTTVAAGTLRLAGPGSLRFTLADGGAGNRITGDGTIELDGSFVLDVSAVTSESAWTLVDPSVNAIYGETFGLLLAGINQPFAALGDGLYSTTAGGFTWTYDQGTGQLSVAVPEPAVVGLFGAALVGLIGRRRRAS